MKHTQKIDFPIPSLHKEVVETVPYKPYMPSFSALAVIYCLNALSKKERWHGLVPFEDVAFYRFCLKHYSHYSALLSLIYRLPEDLCLKTVEWSLAYGAPQHFACRKNQIREYIEQGIRLGATQLVSVGAGFDIELLRAARNYPDIACIEIDTPLMVSEKQALLMGHFGALPKNYHSVGADLSTDSLVDSLAKAQTFSRMQQSVFIAEGITMYLKEQSLIRLLADIKAASKPGSQLIMTALEPDNKKYDLRLSTLSNWLLSRHQETYAWRMQQTHIPQFLETQGFEFMGGLSYAELQASFRDDREMESIKKQCGEYVIQAVCR